MRLQFHMLLERKKFELKLVYLPLMIEKIEIFVSTLFLVFFKDNVDIDRE